MPDSHDHRKGMKTTPGKRRHGKDSPGKAGNLRSRAGNRNGSGRSPGGGHWCVEEPGVPMLQPGSFRPGWVAGALRWVFLSLFVLTRLAGLTAEELVSSRIEGKVTDAEGEPLAGATVQVNRARGFWARSSIIAGKTDRAGRYELKLEHVKGQPLVIIEMFADARGYIRSAPAIAMDLSQGGRKEVDFKLNRGEVLKGFLKIPISAVERSRGVVEGKANRILEAHGEGTAAWVLNARCQIVGGDGGFEFYLPQGVYTLRLHGYSTQPLEWTGFKTGTTGIQLELPRQDWNSKELEKAFDDFWSGMDRHYSYFFLKPEVNWKSLGEKYRPLAAASRNADELAGVLQEMLMPLRDLHVRIESPSGVLQPHKQTWNYNGNFQWMLSQLKDRVECGKFAVVGRTSEEGIGCFLMLRQSEATPELVQKALVAMNRFKNAPGFVVDLRRANGGNEALAREIASWFTREPVTYARSKYRNGPGHEEFGDPQDRVLEGNPDSFSGPVVCITGPGAVSSGEAFVQMMKSLPTSTLVGQPTRGASGNPAPWPVGKTGIMVHFSRWVDLMPDGSTFEGQGIRPQVEFEEDLAAYKKSDPTFLKALSVLRSKLRTR